MYRPGSGPDCGVMEVMRPSFQVILPVKIVRCTASMMVPSRWPDWFMVWEEGEKMG